MKRIVIVNQKSDDLCHAVKEQLPKAIEYPDFNWQPQPQDIICWIPNDEIRVDLAVSDLVAKLDQSAVRPAKIIMKSIAGTADDATDDQLTRWYGETGQNMVMDHLYAIKMIDELEFPYTIVRSLPLTNDDVQRCLMTEGQPYRGNYSNIQQVATIIAQATDPEKFKNQSIGI